MRPRSILPSLSGLVFLLAVLAPAVHGQGFQGVTTWHNDNAHTGQNLNETVLTPQNVNSKTFGKLFSFPVDGQVFAQPLYVPSVNVQGQGVHNVLFVATENDSIYAFDADGITNSPLWQVSFINLPNLIPEPCTDFGGPGWGCAIDPTIGITGTPVIDPVTGTLYVVTVTDANGSFVQQLHALDITSGAEKFGGPVVIAPTFKSPRGLLSFDAEQQLQRPALLLAIGTVYVAWTGQHGWVVGYDALTLAQVAVFNTSPDTGHDGIWQTGAGVAEDSQGNLYVATATGDFNVNTGGSDYGETLLKLNTALQVVDYFTPMDQACRTTNDLDLASAGPMILPPQGGTYPDEVIMAGKGGKPCDLFGSTYAGPIYLVNRDSMGGYNSTQDQVIQTVEGSPYGYRGSPAYWQGPTATYVYLSGITFELGDGDFLKMYTLSDGLLSTSPVAQTLNVFPVGSTPSISANGSTNGILWAVERQQSLGTVPGSLPAILYAYDATDVANEFYDSTQVSARDQAGLAAKFVVPTIANGRVYIGTQTEVDVYGLLPATVSPTTVKFGIQLVGTTSSPQTVTLNNIGSSSFNITGISATGDFAETNTCGNSLSAGSSCSINLTFTPTAGGPRTGTLTITDTVPGSPQTVSLTGTGAAASLQPHKLSFAQQKVGTTSAAKTVTVTNLGTTTIAISSITITGTNPADFAETNNCGNALSGGKSCTVSVTFTPTATGLRSAQLKVVDNGGGGPQVVTLSGTGQ